MSSPTDSRSDAKEWSFGDGICPSASDFQQCYQESFEDWRQAARTSSQCLDPVLYLDHFLALLEKVPHYVHNLPEGIHLTGRQYALDISLRVQTTDCPDCDQRWKSIDYFQFLALPKPRIYKENKLSPQQQETDFAAQQSPYFSSIVLAWSYIISCRWAEILQASGLETIIRHSNSRSLTDSFWDIIIGHQWSAEVKSGSAPSYSPWMLRDEDIDPAQSQDWHTVSPDSTLAFKILLNSCKSGGDERQFLAGFFTVLMLPTVQRRPPALSPPAPIVHPATPYDGPETRLHSLFHAIDKCLALSAIPDALHSLLCSAFFDPRIPCTFLSAASLGITHALSLHTQPDHLTLLTALSRKAPHLVLPWDSLVVNGLAYPLLRIALGMLPCSLSPALESNLPPLCLLAAFWTGTLQSFLQVSYTQNQNHSDSIRIPRVHEFSIAFFCNPDAAVPWSPAPPFGSSMRTNLSLAVSAHCAHNHRPRSYAVFWSLKSGEKQQAGEVLEPRSHRAQIVEYPRCAYSPTTEETKEPLRQPDMQNQSWAATSRLFNWHRAYDGGLWLEDGRMDMEEIRKLQAHSWIKEPWSDDENEPVAEEEEEEEEEESRPGIDRAGVSEWIESLKEQTAKTIEISLEGSCA